MAGIALGGAALHAGCPASVVLVARSGPIALRQRGVEKPLYALGVARTDQGVAVHSGALRVDLVEHVLAAVGGLGLTADLRIDVMGPEVPLLDGGARRFGLALRQLGLRGQPSSARIIRPACLEIGSARYHFAPSAHSELSVEIAFDHPLVQVRQAAWRGDPDDFLDRIARARTFGFIRDAAALLRAGRARAVDLAAVVVLDDEGGSPTRPAPEPDECARHKLLDLIGDLTLCGGVPRGRIEAFRPGHGATHQAIAMAREAGILSSPDCGFVRRRVAPGARSP